MKRITALILSLCLMTTMMTALPITASADTYGDYTYTISDGEVIITDFDTSVSGAITIPEKIEGYPVTGIGDYAFAECSSLTGITIPDSVTVIGDSAFYACSSLTEIAIPNSVTSIGEDAFYCCSGLTKATIPNSVTSIGAYAFSYTNLTGVTIPNNITNIGLGTFAGCSSLTDITIPNSVATIGAYAFEDCSNLTEIIIPKSVTLIGTRAFLGCGLTDVYYTGSEADWNKISIDNYSEQLPDATIHYNFVAEEPVLSIGFDKSSNEITVTATKAVSGASLLAARYQDGKLVGIEPVSISLSAGENTIESPMSDYSGADTVKFLIWESLTSVEPLCASFTESL